MERRSKLPPDPMTYDWADFKSSDQTPQEAFKDYANAHTEFLLWYQESLNHVDLVVVVVGGRVVVVVLVVVVAGAEIVAGDVRTAVLPRAGADEHAAARRAITASPIPLRTTQSA